MAIETPYIGLYAVFVYKCITWPQKLQSSNSLNPWPQVVVHCTRGVSTQETSLVCFNSILQLLDKLYHFSSGLLIICVAVVLVEVGNEL